MLAPDGLRSTRSVSWLEQPQAKSLIEARHHSNPAFGTVGRQLGSSTIDSSVVHPKSFVTALFVVLPVERTPHHFLKPGNAAQHWTASSARVRHELGSEEPVTIEEAIRQTIRWERENPPEVVFLPQFDYAAEDARVAGHHR